MPAKSGCTLLVAAAISLLLPLGVLADDKDNPAYACKVLGLDAMSGHHVAMWQFWSRGGQGERAADEWAALEKAMGRNPAVARMGLQQLSAEHAQYHLHMTKDCSLLTGLRLNEKFDAVGHAQALLAESSTCPICNPPRREQNDGPLGGPRNGGKRSGRDDELLRSSPGTPRPSSPASGGKGNVAVGGGGSDHTVSPPPKPAHSVVDEVFGSVGTPNTVAGGMASTANPSGATRDARAAQVADDLIALSQNRPIDDAAPQRKVDGPATPDETKEPLSDPSLLSSRDVSNAGKVGVEAYVTARSAGDVNVPRVDEELLKKAMAAVAPVTPADVAAKAVNDRATDLQRLYSLPPTKPQTSTAAEIADRFLDLLPGSPAKSNTGGLSGLRDEGVGLIGSIGRAVDKLMHVDAKTKRPQGDKPVFQDLLKN